MQKRFLVTLIMKIKYLVLLICLLLYACSDSNHQYNRLPSNATILAFGDSLTYGTGAGKGQDYPSILASLTQLPITNAGIPGEISSKGLERLPALLDQHKPDLLILIHGGNDILRKLPRAELKDNLKKMLTEANTRNIPVAALGIPEPGLFLKCAEVYQQLSDETGVQFECSTLPKILGDTALKSDIAHPNAKGYQQLAERIHELLQLKGFVEN